LANTISDPGVRAAFEAFPPAVRERLMELRALIYAVAGATEGVGELEEALKWGQPSYLTSRTRSGSTIRIGREKKTAGDFGIYFKCNTDLVSRFRERHGAVFRYEGNRAILFAVEDPFPDPELGDCISLALRYHLDKRGARRGKGAGGGRRPGEGEGWGSCGG